MLLSVTVGVFSIAIVFAAFALYGLKEMNVFTELYPSGNGDCVRLKGSED
jgi:hypothetical protein